jgi:acyl-CoA hydrolase
MSALLPANSRILVQGASAESRLLADAVMATGASLGALTFTGIFVPGLNRHTYTANANCRVETFFMTPELKAVGEQVTFLPLSYRDILQRLRSIRIDAAIFMVSPPDETGICSFGPVVDFLADMWQDIPVRIAHINPLIPRTHGYPGIPFDELTAYVEAPQDMLAIAGGGDDPVSAAIAKHIAPLIQDGATLQTGLGKMPDAILRALTTRRGLRIFSGLIGDAVVDLEECGALAQNWPVTTGVAIGSARLYDAITRPTYSFRPVSHTHNVEVMAKLTDFVAINSAIEVDLLGQAFAEFGPSGLMSGPGGASDFAAGARQAGGLRIIVLPASAAKGTLSRIILPGAGAGPVSLSRMDIDLVATEHGVAELRGRGVEERAQSLIAIAAPGHRDALRAGWQDYAVKF